MWIFMKQAMLSVVEDKDHPELLHVRARLKGDIEAVFPDAEVIELTVCDYRFRVSLPREQVVEAIAEQMRSIDYVDFKSQVHDRERHDAYVQVWSAMQRAQVRAEDAEMREPGL